MSLSVGRCCFLLVVDCIYKTLKKNCFSPFCINCPLVLLILSSAVRSFCGIALYKELLLKSKYFKSSYLCTFQDFECIDYHQT